MNSPAPEKSASELFVQSVEKIIYPAFLCEGNKDNPYDLKIINCNHKFLERFGFLAENVIGNNYDFLFENIELSYSSDSQLQYSNLLRSVKSFHPTIITLDLNHNKNRTPLGEFKIIFTPSDFREGSKLFCSFVFEEILIHDHKKEELNIATLAHNLESALQNERMLHKISRLIACDLSLSEVANDIAKILGEHLQVDRCILYDQNDGKSTFISEYSAKNIKPVTKNQNNEIELELISGYIDFHHKLTGEFNLEERRGNTTLISSDIRTDLRFDKIADLCKKMDTIAQISVTTSFDSKINGGLFIIQSSPREWTVEEVELIEMISDQFSVAIDRSFSISQVIISNQNLLEKTLELKQALKQEKEMRKMQNDFVAIVSHEFKTPLQIIDSTREVIARKLKSYNITDEIFDKSLAKIKSGVVRMNGLIQSTLNLSKMEMDNGDIVLNKQPFNLKAFVLEIIERNKTLALDKGIKIEMAIDALPESYNGDQKLLDHCFANVITNAIKYSKPNTLVKLGSLIEDKKVIFKVTDQGIGIPKEDLQNIGTKFFRAKNTLSVSGTGIGLFLTKYFIELHNGSVLIESELNVGTTISIMLPIS